MRFHLVSVILLFVYFLCHHVESKATIDQVRQMVISTAKGPCMEKTGVTEETLANTHKGQFPPDPKLQCYFKCVLEKFNVIKGDKMSASLMLKQVNVFFVEELSKKYKVVLDECMQQVTSADLCEAAWQFTKCWYEADSSLYLFP